MGGLRMGLAALVALGLFAAMPSHALAQARQPAAPAAAAKVEFIDIRWDGVDRMCVVYPDGHVDFIGLQLKGLPRPDNVDRRAFYMTIALNRMAAQGYEFVGMISDEIVMKRAIR